MRRTDFFGPTGTDQQRTDHGGEAKAAYTEPDAPLNAASDWHDRWLPGVLYRLEHGSFALDRKSAWSMRSQDSHSAGFGSNEPFSRQHAECTVNRYPARSDGLAEASLGAREDDPRAAAARCVDQPRGYSGGGVSEAGVDQIPLLVTHLCGEVDQDVLADDGDVVDEIEQIAASDETYAGLARCDPGGCVPCVIEYSGFVDRTRRGELAQPRRTTVRRLVHRAERSGLNDDEVISGLSPHGEDRTGGQCAPQGPLNQTLQSRLVELREQRYRAQGVQLVVHTAQHAIQR